ncbi:hypothetical protein JX265_002213 [Neoarthrinium moseri]|uniref:Thioesterase domain-containing protein n=1 Tax=Neoarthrinium moseri TaxID=1658444 RepID=A0A9P9WTT7_9PEZI|nr:hypothetical protein JX266_004173 [Neoarthrinium moseri]KAI1879259.1 hypothetical protein JX265_002213 [Neoarthrinium moseri]
MASTPDSTPSDLAHFLRIPWCAKYLNEPLVHVWAPPPSRILKPTGEDTLWSTTLNTRETFSAFIAFYNKPEQPTARVDQVRAFLTADHGLQGYPGVIHGGIVATILDEVTGLLPTLNRDRTAFPRISYMTAYLNTTYRQPVRTPATILVSATITKSEGRKLYIKGTIQDEAGTVLAEADVLFVALKHRL